ncbi:glycerol transporter [Fimicolochytrium jonesii]|uniref:glycerol transporter n=1 Tax=Fimicolochytrium jonesii TaxID=1396493 RepID=UPI0022FF06F7|nr:glycerol transporter [Fimicolochytrium jonesii]KAI8816422.1 glycerol transporter [Fimicolochytrium jonesii]
MSSRFDSGSLLSRSRAGADMSRGGNDAVPLLPRTSEGNLFPERTDGRPAVTIARRAKAAPPPPRWLSLEFVAYYAVIIVGLPALFRCAWGFSDESHPSYAKYSRKLSKGWMLGRKVDNSDSQYASFRNNMVLLAQVAVGYLILSHAVQRRGPRFRPLFSLAFSLIFLGAIHGSSLLKILAITGVNFLITSTIGHLRLGVALTWIWSVGILFANQEFKGYRYGSLSPSLAWLDQVQGFNMRWWVTFNFTTLRMISYSMDYYALTSETRDKSKAEFHRQTCSECSSAVHPGEQCSRARVQGPLRAAEYSLVNYFCYLLYVPLYLAGPIITYNDFIAQLRYPPRGITFKGTALYAVRWMAATLLMEWMLHTIYVVAIKDTKAWEGFSPFQMSMVGYFNLKLIWLKLLIIWRFFRLWGMADRVETTENMTRCMSDNYSAMEFWRSWHRSFNRWLIRYMYVPLGGSRYYALNIFPTFTFVAIWHDISRKLLTWGWSVSLFILPEYVLRMVFANERWRQKLGPTTYRHITASAAVVNIILMMIANLVGFAVGVDGVKEMLGQIFNANGIIFVISTFVALFSAVQLMFELRNEEERRGWQK